jgi:hypothetical protein
MPVTHPPHAALVAESQGGDTLVVPLTLHTTRRARRPPTYSQALRERRTRRPCLQPGLALRVPKKVREVHDGYLSEERAYLTADVEWAVDSFEMRFGAEHKIYDVYVFECAGSAGVRAGIASNRGEGNREFRLGARFTSRFGRIDLAYVVHAGSPNLLVLEAEVASFWPRPETTAVE